jgi:hypothetical protein
MTAVPTPEFSRPVPIDQIGMEECVFDLRAEPHERAALARRFELVEIGVLTAVVRLAWVRGRKAVRLAATFHAEVTQTCVVTLEPVPSVLDQEFVIPYAAMPEGGGGGEVVVSLEDETEPLIGPVLDIGEVVAEELALSLDPYPRSPGAGVAAISGPESGEGAPSGAFAVLAAKFRKE